METNKGLEAAWECVNKGKSFFLTGRAGTGKSTFLKNLLKERYGRVAVLAPTGIAAINVKGMTIHSFFRFPLRPMMPNDKEIKIFPKSSEKRLLIQKLETLVIDEISMVRPDLLDAIDTSLRRNRGNKKAFGGVQVILIGDLFQLEPVVKEEDLPAMYRRLYPGNFFFDAQAFGNTRFEIVELTTIYRQNDPVFIDLLEKVRKNSITLEDLRALNVACMNNTSLSNDGFSITLAATNKVADQINLDEMNALTTKSKRYKALRDKTFALSKMPTSEQLTLKVGAQVIFIKNDKEGHYANGSLGKVTYLGKDFVKVALRTGEVIEVNPSTWYDIKYEFDPTEDALLPIENGSFKQLPLKLAWAITIHKSQGLTFEEMTLDLGRGAFVGGQTYVALSRCVSMQGLNLKRAIRKSDIIINQRIIDFYREKSLY